MQEFYNARHSKSTCSATSTGSRTTSTPFPSRSNAPCLRYNHDGSFIQFSSASNSCSSCSSLSYHATTAPRDRQLRNRRLVTRRLRTVTTPVPGVDEVRSSCPSGSAASVTESPIVRISEHVATPPTAVAQLAVSNALGSAHVAISGETFLAPNSSRVQPTQEYYSISLPINCRISIKLKNKIWNDELRWPTGAMARTKTPRHEQKLHGTNKNSTARTKTPWHKHLFYFPRKHK